MEEKNIRAAILRVFDAAREKPGAAFDEKNFLTFLIDSAEGMEDTARGFAGMKRLNAFYDALQLECAVCLDVTDADRNWAVDDLAARIVYKKSDRTRQLAQAQGRLEQAKAARLVEPLKFGVLLILPGVLAAWSIIGGWTTGFVLIALGLVADFMIYRQQLKDVAYYRQLLGEIESSKPQA